MCGRWKACRWRVDGFAAAAARCLMVRVFWVALGLLVGGCAAPMPPPLADDAIIYVIGRSWHTDIGLPVEEISGPLAAMETPFPGVRFLTFGFGERQFLIDRKKDLGSMLRALLPRRSALLMTVLRAPPEEAFGAENVVVLRVSRAGLDRIEAALWAEFEHTAEGGAITLADGPYPGSVFYAGQATYDGFFTCNTWTVTMLRAGGLAMPAAGI